MQNHSVNYEEIGEVYYLKSKKAKRINLTVSINSEIKVSVPYNVSFEEAERFVLSKKIWIKKAINKMNKLEEHRTLFINNNFKSKFRTLNLIPAERANVKLNLTDNIIELYYPGNINLTNESLQHTIRKALDHVWNVEANEFLPKQLIKLALKTGLNYKSLKIKNIYSCWGKCLSDKTIILSIHLIRLPDYLIDYVILHELCHTVHMNHGIAFWKLLETLCNFKARIYDKELKNYNTRIY